MMIDTFGFFFQDKNEGQGWKTKQGRNRSSETLKI